MPKEYFNRPKAGFKIPLKKWLREDIRDWAEPLLDKSMLEEQGLFERDKVRQLWNQHLSGKYDHHAILWSILTFQSWFNRFGP